MLFFGHFSTTYDHFVSFRLWFISVLVYFLSSFVFLISLGSVCVIFPSLFFFNCHLLILSHWVCLMSLVGQHDSTWSFFLFFLVYFGSRLIFMSLQVEFVSVFGKHVSLFSHFPTVCFFWVGFISFLGPHLSL